MPRKKKNPEIPSSYKDRKAAGLCPKCGGARDGSAALCGACRDAASAKKRKQAADGACLRCGESFTGPGVRCSKCIAIIKSQKRSRVDNGACPVCLHPGPGGGSVCADCLKKQHEARVVRTLSRRTEGLCGTCGKPAFGEKNCEECRKKALAAHYKSIGLGLCPRCRKPNPGDRQHCPDCLAKIRAENDDYISRGLCVDCHVRPIANRRKCAECRDKRNAERRERNLKGNCIQCDGPRDTPRKLCSSCRREYKKEADDLLAQGLCYCGNAIEHPDRAGRCNACLAAKVSRYHHGYHLRKKERIVAAYGHKCVCCGERRIEFLEIDHIRNDGAQHRKSLRGRSMYDWIIANNFPKEKLQLLCRNCNKAKYESGICPHVLENDDFAEEFHRNFQSVCNAVVK